MALTGAQRQARYMAKLLGDDGEIRRENIELKKLRASDDAYYKSRKEEEKNLRDRNWMLESMVAGRDDKIAELKAHCLELEKRLAEIEVKKSKRVIGWKAEHLNILDRWCADRKTPVPVGKDALLDFSRAALELYAKSPELFR